MNSIQTSAVPEGRGKRALKTFVICLLVGPPAGAIFVTAVGIAIVVVGPMLGFDNGSQDINGPAVRLLTMLVIGMMGIPMSYIYGGIPAAVGGALLAAFTYFRGRPPIWVPLAIAVVPFLLLLLQVATTETFDLKGITVLGIMDLGFVFAAMVSWFVVVKSQFDGSPK